MAGHQDPFFQKNKFSNYGETGKAVKALLESYLPERERATKIASIGATAVFGVGCPPV